MKSINYKVSRENIYVGEVVRTDKIYRNEGNTDYFRTKPGQLYTGRWFPYRSMLFVPNEEKLSNDLIYQSPSYPILNVTDDNTCLELGERSIVIKDAYNLAVLLEYFGYNKDLTFEDIMRIRKIFFTGRFGMDNCKLFGMEEFIPSSFKPHIQNPDKRYELYKKSLNLGSERRFGSIPENQLPRELMDILDERGKGDLYYLGDIADAFMPSKEEGLIKKLSNF